MTKSNVIQNNNSREAIKQTSQKKSFFNFHFALHRGPDEYSSDPYLKNRSMLGFPRCSGVDRVDFSLEKKSPTKETSKENELKVNSNSFSDYNFFRYIKNAKHARLIGTSATALLALLALFSIAPIVANTDEADAAVTGTASTITVTTSYPTATLNIGSVTAEGKFATSSAEEMAIFGVQTTNYSGYTLTIAAPDDTGTLVNGDSTGTFTSITTPMDEDTFDNATYNGYWGYKPSKIGGVKNVSFRPSPTTDATTLDVTSAANASEFNMYTIALGARASYTQAAGTYTKTMNLVATANPITYSVSYRDNSGDAVANLPDGIVESSTTHTTTTSTEITLSSVTPSRSGYVFAGWCDTATTSSGTVCSGTTYAAGSTYGINQTTSNTIVLYALWANNSYGITIKTATGIDSVSLNGTVCTSASGCLVSGLEGGKSYVLAAVPSSYYTFSSWSKTNASSSIADTGAATTTYTVDGATDTITPSATSNAKGVTVNFSYAGGGTAGVSSVVFKESATGTTVGTVSTSGGTVNLNTGVGYTMTTTSASGYGVKSYAATAGTIADTASTSTTNYFIPNSSTATITVNTCLKTIPTTTMQAYSTNIDYLCDDATGTLTDSRDNRTYTVGVVTSGNRSSNTRTLWMTQNLGIGCTTSGAISSKTLTSSDSNVSSNYTTPTTSGHTNTYTDSKIVCSSNTSYGAWYNYVAATAGTINTNGDNSTEASYSICPSGWKLPNHSQISAAASNWEAFSPVTGGYYSGGSLYSTGNGYWWSTSAAGGTSRWYLNYTGSYLYTSYTSRYSGFYVRCVKS